MKKLILALLSLFLLAGCGTSTQALAVDSINTPQSSEIIEVDRIYTDTPFVTLEVDEPYLLRYYILPTNATDKSVRIDMTYSQDVVTVEYDEEVGGIVANGRASGSGIVSLITTNGKFVSYSFDVVPKIDPPADQPLVYKVEDLVEYYNSRTPYEPVEYVEKEDYVGYEAYYDFGPATVATEDALREPVDIVRNYLPSKDIVEKRENYTSADWWTMCIRKGYFAGTYDCEPYYVSVDVSSNMFAAVSLFSWIDDGRVILNICIYDGRDGLYIGLQ